MSHHLLNDNEPTACFVLFPPFTHTPTLFFPVALTVNNGKQCVTIQLIGTKVQRLNVRKMDIPVIYLSFSNQLNYKHSYKLAFEPERYWKRI